MHAHAYQAPRRCASAASAIALATPLRYIAGHCRGAQMLLASSSPSILLLQRAGLVIIVQAILSWLVAFNVINTHNDFVRTLPQRARPDHRAALPADPQDPARFRRHRFLARGRAADLIVVAADRCSAASPPDRSLASYR